MKIITNLDEYQEFMTDKCHEIARQPYFDIRACKVSVKCKGCGKDIEMIAENVPAFLEVGCFDCFLESKKNKKKGG